MELREYWHLFRKRLWLIVLAAIVAGVAAYAFSIRQTPIYQASTRLRVNQGSSNNPSVTYSDVLLSERLTATYAQMLKAKPILVSAFEEVGLNPEAALRQASVSVQPVRDTQLIDLQVQHPLPELAAATANALPQVFISFNNRQLTARYQDSKVSLQAELAKLNDEIKGVAADIAEITETSEGADENRSTLLENRLAHYRNSYGGVLSQLEVIRLAEANASDTITVVEPATVPISPISPRLLMNTLLALIVGGMIGLGAAFLIEYLDDTVKTPDDVVRIVGLSTLGVIARRRNSNGERRVVTVEDPRAPDAEAYRSIRTGIQFSSVDDPIRSLLVTSAGPKEGKSTTAANLAVVMAKTGKRVVLVDADLRKPSQHKFWDLPNTVGLTGALLMEMLPENLDYLLAETDVENLWLITSGQLPPNPSELLGSKKFQVLCERLLHDHDMLILDSPPALAVTDPVILGQALDGVLLVVDAGNTREPALVQVLQELDKVNAHVIGVALNKYKRGRDSGYYYYAYDRYYGDDSDGNAEGGRTRRRRGRSGRTSTQKSQTVG